MRAAKEVTMNSPEGPPPELGLGRFLGQVEQGLQEIVEFASPLPEGCRARWVLIANPEDLGSDEAVFLVENRQVAG